MELEQFDDLTRHLGGAGSSRRQALRALGSVLLGGAFAGLAARLGLADVTAVKAKNQKTRRKHERKSQPERKAQGQLHAEGRGKGKGKGKKKPKPNPCPPNLKSCPDGSCIATNACCPGKKSCPSEGCIPENECCELLSPLCGKCEEAICVAGDWICKTIGEKDCGGGVCVWEGECCPGEKHCVGYTECFAADDCCPNAIPPLCAECDKVVCENGGLVCRPKSNCCPAGSKYCAGMPWGWYEWLPHGCCPVDHYFPDPRDGKYVCSSPPGQSEIWAVCDPGALQYPEQEEVSMPNR